MVFPSKLEIFKLKIKRRPREPIEILKAEEKPLSIEEPPIKPMLGPSREEELEEE